MENKRLICLIAVLLSLSFSIPVFAETVILKSGKKIEGKIIERTDDYVKVDQYGVPITYFLDDIESIEGDSVSSDQETIKGSLVFVGDANLTYASYFFELPPGWAPEIDNSLLELTHKKGYFRGMHKNGGVILIAPTKTEGRYSSSEFINGYRNLETLKGCSYQDYNFTPSFNYPYEVYLEHCPRINRYGLILFAKLPTHVINFDLFAPGENENYLTTFLEDFNKVINSFRWTLGLNDKEIADMLRQ